MKIESLTIGMKVTHPHYGEGVVKALNEQSAEIRFDGGVRTVSPEASNLQPSETMASITNLDVPLTSLIWQTASAIVSALGLEEPESVVGQLGARWNGGRMVLHPADPSLQPKEVPLETFFHKIVMMRNNLRVLEQKINGHDRLNDGEKVEMQQYVTRCYGSMTTFNVLFREKEDQF